MKIYRELTITLVLDQEDAKQLKAVIGRTSANDRKAAMQVRGDEVFDDRVGKIFHALDIAMAGGDSNG